MTANGARGEVQVELDGASYDLMPNHQALARIEGRLGGSFQPMAKRLALQDMRIGDFVPVLYECLAEGGCPLDEDQVAAAVLRKGLVAFYRPVSMIALLPFAGTDQWKQLMMMATEEEATTGPTTTATRPDLPA